MVILLLLLVVVTMMMLLHVVDRKSNLLLKLRDVAAGVMMKLSHLVAHEAEEMLYEVLNRADDNHEHAVELDEFLFGEAYDLHGLRPVRGDELASGEVVLIPMVVFHDLDHILRSMVQ